MGSSFLLACPPAALCRHCASRPRGKARRLCWSCYGNDSIRALYPCASVSGGWNGDRYVSAPPPDGPTDALPRTPEKVAVLEVRAALGQALHHKEDAKLPCWAALLTAWAGGRPRILGVVDLRETGNLR